MNHPERKSRPSSPAAASADEKQDRKSIDCESHDADVHPAYEVPHRVWSAINKSIHSAANFLESHHEAERIVAEKRRPDGSMAPEYEKYARYLTWRTAQEKSIEQEAHDKENAWRNECDYDVSPELLAKIKEHSLWNWISQRAMTTRGLSEMREKRGK